MDETETWALRLCEEAKAEMTATGNTGTMEQTLERVAGRHPRRALELWVRARAQEEPPHCPKCRTPLHVEARRKNRRVRSRFGTLSFQRGYGFCPSCRQRHAPGDAALGLAEFAPASPRVQEICALLARRAPAGQVEEDTRRLTGLNVSASSIHREARRQGDRALALRETDTALLDTAKGQAELHNRASLASSPFTLVIELDAWNIRERDEWGRTTALRQAGQEPGRWHWVYTGTIFRLDQRGTTASGRPVISERGYVATRHGVEAFGRQVHAQALQRGLLHAECVLVLADGAVWIWNLVSDRFPNAIQRVDLFHVREHLHALAEELFGKGTAAAKQWVDPYCRWLDQRQDGGLDVIAGLEGLRQTIEQATDKQREALDREIGYLSEHKHRMAYQSGKSLGQPVGSGAIESTCSQYQRRFKLTGQFWSLAGDEAFLALDTIHRNGQWLRLFPHDSG
jgi:hypothetical protein